MKECRQHSGIRNDPAFYSVFVQISLFQTNELDFITEFA